MFVGFERDRPTCVWSAGIAFDDDFRLGLAGAFARPFRTCVSSKTRARLNMANTPKKVKDPTEDALSAIQEALNISDGSAPDTRGSAHADTAPGVTAGPSYDEPS